MTMKEKTASDAPDSTVREALTELVHACNRYDEDPDRLVVIAAYSSAVEKAREVLAKPAPSAPDSAVAITSDIPGDYQRCLDMLGDVPGETLEQRLTNYIGQHMALQAAPSAPDSAVVKNANVAQHNRIERAAPDNGTQDAGSNPVVGAPSAPDSAHITAETIEQAFDVWCRSLTVGCKHSNRDIFGQGFIAGWNAKEVASFAPDSAQREEWDGTASHARVLNAQRSEAPSAPDSDICLGTK